MSIQDTLNEAKKELSNDEQMLASAFKLEKFYKKHKIKIFALITLLALYFGGKAFMEMQAQQKLNVANDAFVSLQEDENNTAALEVLKSNNPALFELYSYQKAMKTTDAATLKTLAGSKNETIADLSSYHLAVLEGKPAKSELMGDVALIDNAYLFIKEGKMEEAKEQLELISEESPVYRTSKMIKHYTLTAK